VSRVSAIGDLAGILGGPVVSAPPPSRRKKREPDATITPPVADNSATAAVSAPLVAPIANVAPTSQPKLLDDPDDRSDRITAILPIDLLAQVETRVAALRRKKKVSLSGYIEAALRELLATGERDIEALERHRIKARRTISRLR